MMVMTAVRGARQVDSRRSPTAIYPGNLQALHRLQSEANRSRLTVTRLNGLGSVNVPEWAWWAAGGVVAGGVVGFLFMSRKKRR